jgi:signal transduction histidine kinase/DNA-binding response OmpR family regulator
VSTVASPSDSVPAQRHPRVWSLRSVLTASLLLFAVLPTAIVGWVMHQSNLQTVNSLTRQVIGSVVQRVQTGTLEHIGQAHTIFNAMLPEVPNQQQAKRAQELLENPLQFEELAFTLTRMTPNVTYLYNGSAKGSFVGVRPATDNPQTQTRVGLQTAQDEGRRYYSASKPGDRSLVLPGDGQPYDARTRPWYEAAANATERTFTPIYPAKSIKQLVITLVQPVYGRDGRVAGVFAIDLYLQRLSALLQVQRISANGVAFIVDDSGFMVASSTGDELFGERGSDLVRYKPDQSRNPVVRQAYQQVLPVLGKTKESSVQRENFDSRTKGGSNDLVVTMRPFGEAEGLRWSLVVAAPENDFTGDARVAVRQALMVMLAVLLLGAVLATLFARRFSQRFMKLSQAAAQLGRGEVPDVQANAKITEVRELSSVLRTSGEEIVRNRAEIVAQTKALTHANEHLEERVAERTAQLEASREEALGAARAKAAFLATMSHEIRTPLNGVVGMTTLLADTRLDTEQRDYLHTMRVSSDQLLGVINDILDFSKIESGKLELEAEPLSLRATIEEACDIAAARAREKGLELLADLGDDVPEWVLGDVTRLRQVLLNFINNAVKFTQQGQVVVSAHLRGVPHNTGANPSALVEFRIIDSGIGIPLDRQSALFQSFSQVDASTTRKYGGTGLGLAICKRLADLMGGEVGVTSVLGQGATFWFTAQLSITAAPDLPHALAMETASLAGKRALVVDDTALNLRILDKQLKRWGMQTVLFERAQPALDWLADHECDVIITDMHMPEMDGLEFAQTVRARTPAAHVVLLTSGVMPTGDAARVFDARLLKPYRQSQLFNALSRATLSGAVAQGSPSPVVSKQKRILVADDNAINIKVALAMLAKLGYDAAIAVNGREAADRVSQSLARQDTEMPFAAVLMDANMPVMDGLEATQLILATHGADAPPMIALTASVLEEDRQRCLDAGMVGFLAKPLRLDELAEALERYIAKSDNAINSGAARARIQGDNDLNEALNDAQKQPVLMDWSRLEQFKEFDDEDLSMTRGIIALFVQDAPTHDAALAAALAATSSAALGQAAHALKGASLNIGASALSDACAALEASCLQGVWPLDATQQVSSVSDLSQQTLAELHAWEAQQKKM